MFPLQLEHQFVNFPLTDGVEACSGFVEKQYFWIECKCACKPSALLHASGNIRGHLVIGSFQPNLGEQLIYAIAAVRFGHVAPMVNEREGDVLRDGERVVERGVLKEEAHPLSNLSELIQREACKTVAEDANGAFVRDLKANHDPQHDALSRSAAT